MFRLMPFRLGHALAELRVPLGPLVDDTAWQVLDDFVAPLPGFWEWIILEVRLDGMDRAVDIFGAVTDVGDGRLAVAHALESALPPCLEPTRRYLESWSRGEAGLVPDVHVVWFEWDAPLVADRIPILFPSARPHYWGTSDAEPGTSLTLDVIARNHRAAYGKDRDPSVVAIVERTLNALPPGATAHSVQCMDARGINSFRAFLDVPGREFAAFLFRVGWPGDIELARHWGRMIVPPWEPLYFQIELDETGVLPFLCVETKQTSPYYTERDARERTLRKLEAEGLVQRELADALLAWGGTHRAQLDGILGDITCTYHFKVTLDAERGGFAKAYPGFCFCEPST